MNLIANEESLHPFVCSICYEMNNYDPVMILHMASEEALTEIEEKSSIHLHEHRFCIKCTLDIHSMIKRMCDGV